MISLAVLAGKLLPNSTATSTIGIFLFIAILASASYLGLGAAIFSCFISAWAYDFFFTQPYYSIWIDNPEEILALFIIFVSSVFASAIALKLRARSVSTRQRGLITNRLYGLNRRLADAKHADEIAIITARHLGATLNAHAAVLLEKDGELKVCGSYPEGSQPSSILLENALSVWSSGASKYEWPVAHDLILLTTGDKRHGIVILWGKRHRLFFAGAHDRLINLISSQAAAAIERTYLAQAIEQARVEAAIAKLRTVILASISHDLKTPLSVILGSVTSLKDAKGNLDAATVETLLDGIKDEGERLSLFITNLLDMARLEAAALTPERVNLDLCDVVGSALRRASKQLALHHLDCDIPADLELAGVDPILLEQVLFNLLENAAKYVPAETEICLRAHAEGQNVVLEIADQGLGIRPQDLDLIFEKFYRGANFPSKPSGSGLGLTICRGFLGVMGGTITVANRTDGSGAIFTITLPQAPSSACEV